jgi:hypothetical protein
MGQYGFYIAGGLVVLVIVILLLRPLFRRSSTAAAATSNTSWQRSTTPAPAPTADANPTAATEEVIPPEDDAEDDDDPSLEQLTADADKLMVDREYSDAVDAYDSAIEKARADIGPDDQRLADLLIKRGNADRGANGADYDADEDTPWEYQEALAITERTHGPNSEHNLPALKELIAFYDHVGLHDKANTLIYRVRDIEAAKEAATPKPDSTV